MELMWSYDGTKLYVKKVGFDRSGPSAQSYTVIEQWDVKSGRLLKSWKTDGWNSWSVIEWRSTIVFWGSQASMQPLRSDDWAWNMTLKAMDMSSGKILWSFHAPDWRSERMQFCANGRFLLSRETTRKSKSGPFHSLLVLRDMQTGQVVRTFPDGGAQFSPDNRTLATISGSAVKLWDVSDITQKPR